jgi:WD40 repeat protein
MNQTAGRSQGSSQVRKIALILLGLAVVLLLGAGYVVQLLHNHQQPFATATPIPKLRAPYLLFLNAPIQSVVWSPGGNLFAVATGKGSIGVWEVPSTVRWQKNLGTKIWAVAWSPGGAGEQRIVVACDDGKVRMLDALSGRQLLVYSGHGNARVLSVAWSTDPTLAIASGDSDGVIYVWDPNTGESRFTLSQAAPVWGLASGGLYLVSGGTQPGGTIIIWDLQAEQASMQIYNNNQNIPYINDNPSLVEGVIKTVGWSSDATYIATGDTNGNVQILSDTECSCWLYQTGFHAHQGPINSVAWATDNKRFATASDDGTIQLWSAGTWAHLQTFTDPAGAKITSVSWAPDGTALLAGNSAGYVELWEAA